MKPDTVDRLTNQLNTVAPPEVTDMKERHTGREVTMIATKGKPDEVQYVRNFGAWPRNANPYMTRDPQNKPLLAAEKAEVKTPALIIDGRTLMPAVVIAMT